MIESKKKRTRMGRMKLSLKEVAEITNGTLISGNPESVVWDLCIDSRAAKEGDLFVPLL